MKTTMLWITVIVLLLMMGTALADASGYDLVVAPPQAGLLAVNTSFSMTVYDAANGMQPRQRTAVIEAYVVWSAALNRATEYYVIYPDSCRALVGCDWMILNRETIPIK